MNGTPGWPGPPERKSNVPCGAPLLPATAYRSRSVPADLSPALSSGTVRTAHVNPAKPGHCWPPTAGRLPVGGPVQAATSRTKIALLAGPLRRMARQLPAEPDDHGAVVAAEGGAEVSGAEHRLGAGDEPERVHLHRASAIGRQAQPGPVSGRVVQDELGERRRPPDQPEPAAA